MNYPLQFQNQIFKTLTELFNGGRFPHALLLEGPDGSGKQTAAAFAAAMLLCREKEAPCGECLSCKKLKSGNHPDLTTLLPQGKSKSISVDSVRDMKTEAFVSAHESERRVFLIPEAQRLNIQSQNALLKILEEPPENAYFILTVPSCSNLLETVLSRLTVLRMRELNEQERLEILVKQLPDESYEICETLSQAFSTVGQALDSKNDPATKKCIEDAKRAMQLLKKADRYELLKLFAEYEKEREQLLFLLSSLRIAIIHQLEREEREIHLLHCLKIIDIIDEVSARVNQNSALTPLLTAAVGRMANAVLSI